MPSHAVLESDVQRYMGELGYNYALSPPSFSTATTSTTSPDGAPLTVYSETASYSVVVHGTTTDQSISFTVDPTAQLLNAEGPAFHVGSGVTYPLQSPLAGVAALRTIEKHSSGTAATSPAARVTVTSDAVSFATYQLKGGALWLLPRYTYSGSISGSTSASAVWSELAVKPTYVVGSSASLEGVNP
jgi:hypothetical protein